MVKLFLKNSNLCDHNSPTSQTDGQTDGQTDRQTTCDRNTALCTKVHRAVKTEKDKVKKNHIKISLAYRPICQSNSKSRPKISQPSSIGRFESIPTMRIIWTPRCFFKHSQSYNGRVALPIMQFLASKAIVFYVVSDILIFVVVLVALLTQYGLFFLFSLSFFWCTELTVHWRNLFQFLLFFCFWLRVLQ